ncbi:uncharacterized protein VP01_9629g1, partial [Puccinia sorghi]
SSSTPGITRDVKYYVNSCYDCNRNKSLNHRKYGNPIFDSSNVSPSTPAANYLLNIKQLQEQLQINLKAAIQRYKQQANKLSLQPPSFYIGDS